MSNRISQAVRCSGERSFSSYGIVPILLAVLLVVFVPVDSVVAQDDLFAYKKLPVVEGFYAPFADSRRDRFATVAQRIFSRFGVNRTTPVKGHRHAGIDLKGVAGEKVYAIGAGKVVRDYWIFPNRALAVAHHLPDGSVIYSAYVHIQDIQVREGDIVDETTVLGRIFTAAEMRQARYRSLPHLHLEIRRSMADDGRRSFSAMTMAELQEFCVNPEPFLRAHMR